MGNIQFGAPKNLVLWLRDTFNINTFIETGTNRAATTVWAAGEFNHVFTVEGYEPLYQEAVKSFSHISNIKFLLGDSRQHLKDLAKSLTEPAIFWLDAHWCGESTFGVEQECPVNEELRALNETSVEHFILIDDARLFVAPPPAPHDPDHWPDITQLCRMLTEKNRYVVVFEDVVVAVPHSAKQQLITFLRNPSRGEEGLSEGDHVSQGPGLKGKVKRLLTTLRNP